MPNKMTLAQTILALEGLPDQRLNPAKVYHGRLVFPAVGALAGPLRELGFYASSDANDVDSDLWIIFEPEV